MPAVGDAPAFVRLTLVIATRGRRDPLRRLLSSLANQTSRSFDVVIVDQNPEGFLEEVVATFSGCLQLSRIVSEPGLSRARNHGLAVARGTVVAFPDDDCWYPSTLVADVERYFALYPGSDILLGQTIDAQGRASLNPGRTAGGDVTPRNVWFSGNSNTLFVRAPVARALGFSEKLGVGALTAYQSGEETDFVLRALARGSRATYTPDIVVFHDQVDGSIGRQQLLRAWRYSAGFGRVLRNRYGSTYALYRVARSFGSAALSLVRGQPKRAIYRVIWGAGTIRGWLF